VDAADATMMITWKETLSYSRRIGVGRGSRLLIIGSGGNGLAFASHASHLGAKSVAMVGTSDRAQTALAVGVTSYHNYRQTDPYRALADEFPEGFDVIIDSLGKVVDGNRALPLLRAGGMFALYGLDEVGKYGLDKSRARGQFRFADWRQYDEPEFHADVLELMRNRVLRAHHWIDRRRAVPLDQICEAIVQVRQRVVVKPLVSVACA
jgi:NADPH:quinone reductase-like Zn-dependent oxidoreductase